MPSIRSREPTTSQLRTSFTNSGNHQKDMPADLKLGYALDTTTNIRQAYRRSLKKPSSSLLVCVIVIFLFEKLENHPHSGCCHSDFPW
ncbi:MAG: efflux RND transporter permease subunit [Saprospiraceae bacterium]|nr:efflux RND transporter permease subunit [Saprospiraceae bacterium]